MAKRKKISREEMRKLISSMRGKYKPKPGEKSGLEILMEERAKDKIREEEKSNVGLVVISNVSRDSSTLICAMDYLSGQKRSEES